MDQAPALTFVQPSSGAVSNKVMAVIPAPTTVLVILPDGKKMRGDRELKDLPKDELLVVIDELINLVRRR